MRPRNSGAVAPSPPSPFRREPLVKFDMEAAIARAVEVFGRELIFDRDGNARRYPEVHQLSLQATEFFVAQANGTLGVVDHTDPDTIELVCEVLWRAACRLFYAEFEALEITVYGVVREAPHHDTDSPNYPAYRFYMEFLSAAVYDLG